jgi:hypothetical protein
MAGTEDIPANYAVIRYELTTENSGTRFTVIQHGMKTQEAHDHSQKNWGYIMSGMKKMLEE